MTTESDTTYTPKTIKKTDTTSNAPHAADTANTANTANTTLDAKAVKDKSNATQVNNDHVKCIGQQIYQLAQQHKKACALFYLGKINAQQLEPLFNKLAQYWLKLYQAQPTQITVYFGLKTDLDAFQTRYVQSNILLLCLSNQINLHPKQQVHLLIAAQYRDIALFKILNDDTNLKQRAVHIQKSAPRTISFCQKHQLMTDNHFILISLLDCQYNRAYNRVSNKAQKHQARDIQNQPAHTEQSTKLTSEQATAQPIGHTVFTQVFNTCCQLIELKDHFNLPNQWSLCLYKIATQYPTYITQYWLSHLYQIFGDTLVGTSFVASEAEHSTNAATRSEISLNNPKQNILHSTQYIYLRTCSTQLSQTEPLELNNASPEVEQSTHSNDKVNGQVELIAFSFSPALPSDLPSDLPSALPSTQSDLAANSSHKNDSSSATTQVSNFKIYVFELSDFLQMKPSNDCFSLPDIIQIDQQLNHYQLQRQDQPLEKLSQTDTNAEKTGFSHFNLFNLTQALLPTPISQSLYSALEQLNPIECLIQTLEQYPDWQKQIIQYAKKQSKNKQALITASIACRLLGQQIIRFWIAKNHIEQILDNVVGLYHTSHMDYLYCAQNIASELAGQTEFIYPEQAKLFVTLAYAPHIQTIQGAQKQTQYLTRTLLKPSKLHCHTIFKMTSKTHLIKLNKTSERIAKHWACDDWLTLALLNQGKAITQITSTKTDRQASALLQLSNLAVSLIYSGHINSDNTHFDRHPEISILLKSLKTTSSKYIELVQNCAERYAFCTHL